MNDNRNNRNTLLKRNSNKDKHSKLSPKPDRISQQKINLQVNPR